MVGRRLAFQRASRSAAETEAELFRGAVLDALAHEFKTPLATISAAAGGLKGAVLRPEQRDLAEMVESEAARLGRSLHACFALHDSIAKKSNHRSS